MILLCNLVCIYVHNICEDKFGSCKMSLSRLGHKASKKIDAYMLVTMLPFTCWLPCYPSHAG